MSRFSISFRTFTAESQCVFYGIFLARWQSGGQFVCASKRSLRITFLAILGLQFYEYKRVILQAHIYQNHCSFDQKISYGVLFLNSIRCLRVRPHRVNCVDLNYVDDDFFSVEAHGL